MAPGPHAGNRSRPAYSGQARFQFPRSVIELFAANAPLEYLPPIRKRRLRPMTGLAAYTENFEAAPAAGAGAEERADKEATEKGAFETPGRRRRRVREQRRHRVATAIARRQQEWAGHAGSGDAWKTLFVSGLAETTTEKVLRWEMELFGKVARVVMPTAKSGLPCGYAFVEFERERDMKVAYKEANGRRIDGKRILVDVERGRTDKNWKPNRLDGPRNAHMRRKQTSAGTQLQQKELPRHGLTGRSQARYR